MGLKCHKKNNSEVKAGFGRSVPLLKQNPSSPSLNWIQLRFYSPTHTSVAVNFLYSQGHRMYLFLMKLVPSCTNLPLHILGRELFSPELLQSREAGVMMVTKPCCSTTGGCIDSSGICLSVIVGNDKRTLTKRLDFIFYKAHSRSFTSIVCMRLRKLV